MSMVFSCQHTFCGCWIALASFWACILQDCANWSRFRKVSFQWGFPGHACFIVVLSILEFPFLATPVQLNSNLKHAFADHTVSIFFLSKLSRLFILLALADTLISTIVITLSSPTFSALTDLFHSTEGFLLTLRKLYKTRSSMKLHMSSVRNSARLLASCSFPVSGIKWSIRFAFLPVASSWKLSSDSNPFSSKSLFCPYLTHDWHLCRGVTRL